jgi:hypothetical protein
MRKLEKEFSFAGFDFPKYLWTLPKGPWRKRLERMRKPVTGGYYGSPPINGRSGTTFYLESDFMPDLRWKWCDEIVDRINHKGWYSDDYQEGTIRGIVMRLPNNRGFIAGWSYGEGMFSSVDYDVFLDESDAAYCADSMAENAAEREREYQEKWQFEQAAEDERIENRFQDAMANVL